MPRAKKRQKRWKIAAIQLTATHEVERNLRQAGRLVRRAAASGARLIALPENFAYLRWEGSPDAFSEPLDGPVVETMRGLALELKRYLLLGSVPETIPRSKRIFNTSVLIGPDGALMEIYRKIHLFDINVRGGVVLQESKNVRAGDRPVVVDTPLGRLGLSICYDLRFPELYRQLAFKGAEVLFVPAAFTAFTGPAHWLPLLRARAIENQCWVVAPAQVGRHNDRRHSHGESVIIDPWGTVVARLPRARGFIEAWIDLGAVERVRRGLPCLEHVRRNMFTPP